MAIAIQNLLKSYDGVVAIRDVNLDIADGEMVVLLGPSGCGKTTTMRCIAGLETPDRGRIVIDERVVFDADAAIDVPANSRNVGMVFQSYAIWPHMTVHENVAFPLEMQRLPAAEVRERVAATLEQVGLADYAERGASALSGGQMQRVALARSLVMQPAVLLFDEPLSNLDARLRDRLRIQLRELQTQLGITGVYVTHDQQEALALADRIVVVSRGEITQVGDPISVYNEPRNTEIAGFIGYSNIFAAQADAAGALRLKAGEVPLGGVVRPEGMAGDAYVCVRPDHIGIALAEGGPGAGGLNGASSLNGTGGGVAVDGEVSLASFMGSHMLYRVIADHGETWEVVSSTITSDIRLGSRVRLAIGAEQFRVLPAQ